MKTILMDIDGVCFDPTDRLDRCRREDNSIDWGRAFSNAAVINDPMLPNANAKVALIVRLLSDSHGFIDVLYMTGRSETSRHATLAALGVMEFIQCRAHPIHMRGEGDIRNDAVIKGEMIDNLPKGLVIIAAIDDDYNGSLGPMYKAHGIPHYKSLDEFIKEISG